MHMTKNISDDDVQGLDSPIFFNVVSQLKEDKASLTVELQLLISVGEKTFHSKFSEPLTYNHPLLPVSATI